MRRTIALLALPLLIAGCKAKEQKPAAADEIGAPQVATSIEDYAVPVDKSDQITSIDAATGDASGMPRDGGAVVRQPRAEADSETAQTVDAPTPAPLAPPLVTPAPPAAVAVEAVPGTN